MYGTNGILCISQGSLGFLMIEIILLQLVRYGKFRYDKRTKSQAIVGRTTNWRYKIGIHGNVYFLGLITICPGYGPKQTKGGQRKVDRVTTMFRRISIRTNPFKPLNRPKRWVCMGQSRTKKFWNIFRKKLFQFFLHRCLWT